MTDPSPPPASRRRKPDIVILCEGDGWLVAAKPPRVITHRNWAHPHERAALQRVRDYAGGRVYPIHRLDRAASGCLLFATDRARAGELQAGLVRGQKEYLAFVRGNLKAEGEILVENPMLDDNRLLKDARSRVWKLGGSDDPRCSLLRVRPETGRYHQVRRHVRDLNHPIIGDTAHGDSRINRWWRENQGLGRLGLHALSLRLELGGGEVIDATCPLFEDLASVFVRQSWWETALGLCPALGLPPLRVDGRSTQVGEDSEGLKPGSDQAIEGCGVEASPDDEADDPTLLDALLEDG